MDDHRWKVATRTLEGLRRFLLLLQTGEPVEVTQVSTERTPDGPITVSRKAVLVVKK